MNAWPEQLARALDGDARVVLVTVAGTRGSVPRGPGTRMIVGAGSLAGTIGGGNLEYKAIEIARALLADPQACATVRRFPLGPSLGQCCGGAAVLAFEPIGPAVPGWVVPAGAALRARVPMARVARLDVRGADALLVTARGTDGTLGAPALDAAAADLGRAALAADPSPAVGIEEVAGARLLVDVPRACGTEIVLFGAGHVGKALVHVLGALPCRVTWIDSRAAEFPDAIPANVEAVVDEAPEHLVARGPAGALWLVTTHSHALDFRLCEQVLARGDARYCGLIGSATKRRRLERHLRAVGFEESVLAALTCPIGIDGIAGKDPGVIAVAVAAELLRIADASAAATHGRETDALDDGRRRA